MISKIPSFTYSGLSSQQIRLLSRQPRSRTFSQGSVYELKPVDFTSNPDYIVISYVWGDPERNQRIRILSTTSLSPTPSLLAVTRTVKVALRYIFDKYPSAYIWLDGICINQDDTEEKQHQIPLMTSIYTKASLCLVYLGELTPSLEAGFNGVPAIIKAAEGHQGRDINDHDNWVSHGLPPQTSPIWTGISGFFNLAWWTRTWTLQEAILPTRVQFLAGNRTFEWTLLDTFIKAVARCYLNVYIPGFRAGHTTFVLAYHVQLLRERYHSPIRDEMNFLSFIEATSYRECFSVHDKIYGVLGLAQSFIRDHLKVDYSKSEAELYIDFARLQIANDPEPFLLEQAPSQVLLPGLPSWCPNFASSSLVVQFNTDTMKFRAGVPERGAKVPQISFCLDSDRIRCPGIEVDRVKAVTTRRIPKNWSSMRNHDPVTLTQTAKEALAWEEECLALSEAAYQMTSSVPGEHWRCLIADHIDGQRATKESEEAYSQFKAFMLAKATGTETYYFREDSAPLMAYFNSCFSVCAERRFFSTQNGRVGLGPLNVKKGDVVGVLRNGPIPFVLREKAEAGIWELVGHAYVHGLMNGEFVEEVWKVDKEFVIE